MAGGSPKICIIGAGFSGICMGIKLKNELNINSFTIYEGLEEVGGTWMANTYPGCSCDIPSHFYSFSFEPDYDWSSVYPPQPEILDYAKGVARKHDLYSHIRFRCKMESLRWNEKEAKWHASILDTKRQKVEYEEFDIVINATGKLRVPYYPEEYLGFKGPLLHTAKWDHTVPIEGKRVGIIGTGSSAVQVVAAIASKVDKLTVFQRKAPHVLPRYNWKYSGVTRWVFKTFPSLRLMMRVIFFWIFELLLYPATRYGSFMNKAFNKQREMYRDDRVKDPELRKKLTPSYPIVCKRIVPHESYYDEVSRKNVNLVTEKIEGLSGNVVKTKDGKEHELDVLVLATGYQQHDFFAPMKIYGKEGIDVLEQWKKDRPQGYLGISSSTMPNLFTLYGPYTALGHSSNIFTIECQVQWTISALKEFLDRKAKTMVIKREPEVKFLKDLDKEMENTVWVLGGCEPWYFDSQGRNTMLWSGTNIKFWRLCRSFNPKMFVFNK